MPDPLSPSADPHSRLRPDPARLNPSGRIGRVAAFLLSSLLQFAFHLLYYPLAFTYDAVAWIVSFGEWAEWRRCVLPYLLPGPVLEIAHGTGTLSLEMSERGFNVAALDLSPAMGKIAAKKKRRWLARSRRTDSAIPPCSGGGAQAGPALVRADVRRLPFRGGYFSSAVSTFPAEFLFHPDTLREVQRTLRAGGRWIIIPTASPEFLARIFLPEENALSSTSLGKVFLQPLETSGFSVRTEIVRRSRSRVLIILAEKTP